MRRRNVIAGLGTAAALWPLSAVAQTPLPIVGFLNTGSSASLDDRLEAFRRGLAQGGMVEGRSVVVEPHFAEGDIAKLPGMAADLVRRQVAVIVAGGPPAIRAAKAATSTIPIVFSSGEDPVRAGFVDSLARPGGNITGISFISNELAAKRFQLATEILPKAELFAILVDRSPESAFQLQNTEAIARQLGKRLLVLEATTPPEIDAALERAAQQAAGAVLPAASASFFVHSRRLIALAGKLGLALVGWDRSHGHEGFLLTYGADISDVYRQVGAQTARILKGMRPADLAIQLPVKFTMVLNLKTAKELGIAVPTMVLAQADEIIE